MENPPPISFPMDNPEPKEDYLNLKPCITKQINNYTLNISNDENYIYFILYDKNDEFNYYSHQMTLSDFQDLSRYFSICEDIKEVLDSLKLIHNKFDNKEKLYSMEIDNNNIIYNTSSQIGKQFKFTIKLEKNEKDKDEIIKSLLEKIKNLENKNNEILIPKNENQKKIINFFDKLKLELNKLEIELINNNEIFNINENMINEIIEKIKINKQKFKFKFDANQYNILNNTIIKKTEERASYYFCVVDTLIQKNSIYSYKLKIINYHEKENCDLYIGFCPSNIDINKGYFDYVKKSLMLTLGKKKFVRLLFDNEFDINLKNPIKSGNIIESFINRQTGKIKFLINDDEIGEYDYSKYINNEIDLVPGFILFNKDDSVELIE